MEDIYYSFLKNYHNHRNEAASMYFQPTQGGCSINLWGTANSDVNAIKLSFPVSDESSAVQDLNFKKLLNRLGLNDFIFKFGDRFYICKDKIIGSDLDFLKSIPWLDELHRSAASAIFTEHVKEFGQSDKVIHKCTLSILFHKDFAPLEKIMERNTYQLLTQPNHNQRKYGKTLDGMGSAFPVEIDSSIYFVTANHCVRDGEHEIELADVDDKKVSAISLLSSFEDVRLLKPIMPQISNHLPIGRSDILELADEVYACGYPSQLGSKPTVSLGHISKLNAQYGGQNGLLQFSSAAINKNNSGGPLLNINGEVIGVIVMRGDRVEDKLQNIAFAVPLDKVLAQFKQNQKQTVTE